MIFIKWRIGEETVLTACRWRTVFLPVPIPNSKNPGNCQAGENRQFNNSDYTFFLHTFFFFFFTRWAQVTDSKNCTWIFSLAHHMLIGKPSANKIIDCNLGYLIWRPQSPPPKMRLMHTTQGYCVEWLPVSNYWRALCSCRVHVNG